MPATPILFLSHVVELGGAENVLLDLLSALDRDRFAPHLATPAEGALTTRAEALDVPTHRVPLAGRSPLRKAVAAFLARGPIRRLADRLGCRALVANSMIAGYAAVRAQRPDLPCVWHLHIVPDAAVTRRALGRAAAVIAASRAGLDAAGIAPGPRAEVVPNGVPDRFFSAAGDGLRARLGVPADAALFGVVGRLDPRKGHEVLLRAMAATDGGDAAPHLVVVGGELFAASQARLGGFGEQLRRRARELGLDGRVHWLGEVDDTAPVLAELDALVVPSTGSEASPRTIAEAHAAGCAVVASAVGGVPTMLDEGASGRLVPPGDAAALGEALAEVAAGAAEVASRVARGRAAAEERYRLRAFAGRCAAVVARAIDGAAPPTGAGATARSRS